MKKWENKIVRSKFPVETDSTMLDQWGEFGWQVAGVVMDENDKISPIIYYLKRECTQTAISQPTPPITPVINNGNGNSSC